jgi:hypothetical protein
LITAASAGVVPQLTTSVLQALLIGGELKIHASALLSRFEARAIASIK